MSSFTSEILQGLQVIGEVASLLKEVRENGQSIEAYLEECNWQPIFSQRTFDKLSDDEKRRHILLASLYNLSRINELTSNTDEINLGLHNISLCPDGSIYSPYI